MGISIIFLTKSGRSNSFAHLILEGEGELLKNKKKKKTSSLVWQHVLCDFQAENCTKPLATHVITFFFFFFLEITSHVVMSCLSKTDFCTPLIKLFCLTEAISAIFDEKSGTRPEKAGRMVTLYLKICKFCLNSEV